jgi:hypothetical protein
MVCNVSDSTAVISNLLYSLNLKLDEYEHCSEMLQRVNMLDRDEEIPQEVLDYVTKYSAICAEGLTINIGGKGENSSGVVAFIKKILAGLKNAIIKIYEFIVDIFKTLFDKHYRSRKQFLGITKHLVLLASRPDIVKKFESIPCAVISQTDTISVIQKSKHLINLIKFCAACTDHQSVDDLLAQFSSVGAIKVQNDQFTDLCAQISGRRWNSFAQAGWTLSGLQKCVDEHINSLSGVETLKETKTNLEKEIKVLEKRIADSMNANTSVDNVRDLQKVIALKLRLTRIIGNSIAIINNRTTGTTNVLKAIHSQALKLMEDNGMVDKTFARKFDEFIRS